MRRLGAFLCLLLLPYFILTAHAEEAPDSTEQLPEEYLSFLDALPDDLRELLPDGLFSLDRGSVGAAVGEMSDFSYLSRTLLSLIGVRLDDCLSLLVLVAGILLLSAILRCVRTSFCSEGVGRAFAFCTTLVITAALLHQTDDTLTSVASYFSSLTRMTNATVPLMGALYAMGGNVSTAVASSAGLSLYVALIEGVIGTTVLPFCGICMALALTRALDPSLRTGTLSATLKKNYTTVISFLMMMLLAMLASQTTLGARSDTLAMRSAKFAAGAWIPVVGGSVGELLRTLSAGVGYLRGTVGICGILLLFLTLLPTLVELFLMRAVWQLSASLADLLGCFEEKVLLDEFASLLGYLIAAVCICSSVLFLSLTLLTHCASAIG